METKLDIECLCFVTPDGEEIPFGEINEASIEHDILRQNVISDEEWLNLKESFYFELNFQEKSNNWYKMHGRPMTRSIPFRKRRTRSRKKK